MGTARKLPGMAGQGDAGAEKATNLGYGRGGYLLSRLLFAWQSQRLVLRRYLRGNLGFAAPNRCPGRGKFKADG